MRDLWWLIHLLGISIWFGVTLLGLASIGTKKLTAVMTDNEPLLQMLLKPLTRTTHIGAGLAALGGTGLSFNVRPKSDLGLLWVTTMQGLGVVAFIISVVVLTRLYRRISRTDNHTSKDSMHRYLRQYRTWLIVVFILLLLSFGVASFKPTL